MNLSNNQFTGSIPTSLGDLSGTGLGAQTVTPETIGQAESGRSLGGGASHTDEGDLQPLALTGLTGLWLAGNQLSGTIPAELGNLASLTTLDSSWNNLTETSPPRWGISAIS